MNNQILKKGAYFTDIHFGKKANSRTHNQDCVNFIQWFCSAVQSDSDIDHIVFLGDWFENRSAINIATMKTAYEAAKMLDALGLPVFFIIGNHDLYHRHSRDTHSLINYQEFKNFHLIEEPTVIDYVHGGLLLCPYMFSHEYPSIKQYLHLKTWGGHFEFKGFFITGGMTRMPTGPDAGDFIGPSYIFSGHFHKRQAQNHVVFIGNTFPMDFGDAGDTSRGMMVYDYVKEEPVFYDWEECPKYLKVKLSDILDKKINLLYDSRVSCVVDIPISYTEYSFLKEKFLADYHLRELVMEESPELSNALSGTETSTDVNELKSVEELVLQMLDEITSEHIDNNILLEEYRALIV